MRRINDRKQDWWRTTPSHPLGIPSSASILGRCQQIWLMSTSLHKAKCLLFPSSKIWVQPLQWIQLDHAWRLSCAIYTLYCSVYIELLNDRDFWVHQVSPGLIDMTHRHPLIDWIFILYNRTWKVRSNQVFARSFQDVTFDFLFWPKADHFGLLHYGSSYSTSKKKKKKPPLLEVYWIPSIFILIV